MPWVLQSKCAVFVFDDVPDNLIDYHFFNNIYITTLFGSKKYHRHKKDNVDV